MNIDADKESSLMLQSEKSEFIKGLDYFSKISNENLNNIFYNLSRSTTLRDIDIEFILHFLFKRKYIEIKDARIWKKLKIDSDKLIEELIFFYFSALTKHKRLNDSLFTNSEFTILNDSILINIFSVQIKYRVFFSVLQNLGLLETTDEKGLVMIKSYALAKKFLERPLRKISPDELEKELEQKKLNGIIAEKFVVEFEHKRLSQSKKIDWVAEYNVNEGYDIASYDSESDNEYNRFVEVKSYEGNKPFFFWSRNEFLVAERRQDKYWLYLVNRKEMNKEGYIPKMIQNPYKLLLNPNVSKTIMQYKIDL